MLTSNAHSIGITLRRFLLPITLVATICGCQPGNGHTVPEHLLGVWKTSHPKYADRYFEIRKDVIIFGQGEGKSEFHAIADVDQSADGESTLYTITHVNHDGQRFTFAFYYRPDDHGALWFKNQKDIKWTRRKP
jgi:hypothetical protein